MIDYGTTRSTIKPDEVEILDSKVFVASEITEVSEDGIDEEDGFQGYEYNLIEYSKDEYIQMIQEKNESLESEVTNTQLALCELYESM